MITHADVRSEADKLIAGGKSKATIVGTMLRNLAARLTADPSVYALFGPYWWVMKNGMRTRGFDFGSYQDEEQAERAKIPGDTTPWLDYVAGMMHQEMASFNPGRDWDYQGADGETYMAHMADPDMDARFVGPIGAAKALPS